MAEIGMQTKGRRAEHRAGTGPIVVVVLQFDGGPLAGRRMLAPASIGVLHFYGATDDGRPIVATTTERGAPSGTYSFARAYDCERTMEHVVVLRWEVARAEAAAARAPSAH